MAKTVALGFLSVAPFTFLVIFFFDLPAATAVFASLVMAFPIALVTLSVNRHGHLGKLRGPLLALFVMLQAGAIGVLAFHRTGATGPFGLPLSLHFLLLLVWLGPLLVTTLAYAATFSELSIDDDLLDRLAHMRNSRHDDGELR